METKLFKMILVLIVSGISMSQSDAQTTGLSGTATNTESVSVTCLPAGRQVVQ